MPRAVDNCTSGAYLSKESEQPFVYMNIWLRSLQSGLLVVVHFASHYDLAVNLIEGD
jgi:hypothetical protein